LAFVYVVWCARPPRPTDTEIVWAADLSASAHAPKDGYSAAALRLWAGRAVGRSQCCYPRLDRAVTACRAGRSCSIFGPRSAWRKNVAGTFQYVRGFSRITESCGKNVIRCPARRRRISTQPRSAVCAHARAEVRFVVVLAGSEGHHGTNLDVGRGFFIVRHGENRCYAGSSRASSGVEGYRNGNNRMVCNLEQSGEVRQPSCQPFAQGRVVRCSPTSGSARDEGEAIGRDGCERLSMWHPMPRPASRAASQRSARALLSRSLEFDGARHAA